MLYQIIILGNQLLFWTMWTVLIHLNSLHFEFSKCLWHISLGWKYLHIYRIPCCNIYTFSHCLLVLSQLFLVQVLMLICSGSDFLICKFRQITPMVSLVYSIWSHWSWRLRRKTLLSWSGFWLPQECVEFHRGRKLRDSVEMIHIFITIEAKLIPLESNGNMSS